MDRKRRGEDIKTGGKRALKRESKGEKGKRTVTKKG